MSQSDEIQKAVALAAEGKRTQARAAILDMDSRITNARALLEFVDAALGILSPTEDNLKILALIMEGIQITSVSGLVDLQAYFMSRAADSSMLPVTLRRHRMTSLKLAPRWIEFSTEADKKEYESIEKEVDTLEKGIDSTLARAIEMSEQGTNKRVQGMVLMSKGSVESARYMQYKVDCMRSRFRAKLWSKYEFMRYPFPEYLLLLSNGDARKLNAHIASFTQSFLKAAKLFGEIDDSTAASAYHNLANDLKTAYRFRAAKKYLAKGRKIALRHNDTQTLRQIDDMAKIIAAKNRDVPDYINGEKRNLDSR